MIRIELANTHPEIDINSLEDIAHFHCSKIKPIIESKLSFLSQYISVISSSRKRQQLFDTYSLRYKTKEALLKIILDGKPTSKTHQNLPVHSELDTSSFSVSDIDKFLFWLISNINLLLIEYPDNLKKLHTNCTTQFKHAYKYLTQTDTPYLQNQILNYKKLTSKKGYNNWNNTRLNDLIGTRTCYYCNRQSVIAVVNKEGNKIATPQLDHFFDKNNHPLLALSFYNLIPCCGNCNLKKSNDKYSHDSHIHPYLDEFGDDGTFTYNTDCFATSIGESNDLDIDILFDERTTKGKKVKNSIEDLGLIDIYSKAHKDDVRELIKLKYLSNDKYLEDLVRMYPSSKLTFEEVYQLAFKNYYQEDDFFRRPLAKLTKDITTELGFY